MDTMQKGVLTLIRSALTGEVLPLPDGFDPEQAMPVIVKHGVQTMCYDGAVRCGISRELPAMQQLFRQYLGQLTRGEKQLAALKKVCDALDSHGFDHLLVKGSLIKAMYPKPEFRPMGDADILIRKKQYAAICPVMEALGFRQTAQGFYDYGWRSLDLYVELHHCLSNPYNTDFNDYLGDGWPRAQKSERGQYLYEYTAEDHFVYLFVHFTKHYRDGGIGIKHAVDLWVYRKANPTMDEAYLQAAMESMGLQVFYRNILQMLRVWFEDAPEDERSLHITGIIFDSGAFGTSEVIRKAVSLRAANKAGSAKKAKWWRMVRILFPKRVDLQRRYPILKKAPFLLPFLWPVRWVTALLFRRDNIRNQKVHMEDASEANVEAYREELRYVGLDYTIKD